MLSLVQSVSVVARADGVRHPRSLNRLPLHEEILVLGGHAELGPCALWCSKGAGHARVLASLLSETEGVSDAWLLSRK